MMRVIVEIHPAGNSRRKRTIATIDIGNVSDLAEVSDYVVLAGFDDREARQVTVHGHRRADGWTPLVIRALEALSTCVSDYRKRDA